MNSISEDGRSIPLARRDLSNQGYLFQSLHIFLLGHWGQIPKSIFKYRLYRFIGCVASVSEHVTALGYECYISKLR